MGGRYGDLNGSKMEPEQTDTIKGQSSWAKGVQAGVNKGASAGNAKGRTPIDRADRQTERQACEERCLSRCQALIGNGRFWTYGRWSRSHFCACSSNYSAIIQPTAELLLPSLRNFFSSLSDFRFFRIYAGGYHGRRMWA